MTRGAGGNGRRIAAVAAAVLTAGLALAHGGAGATPRTRVEGPRAQQLRARQAALARSEHRAVLDLYALETRLARARDSVASLRALSAQLAGRRELTRRRTAAVRHSLVTAQQRLAETLRSLYEQDQPDAVAILLGARSIDQATAGLDNLSRAARANRRLISDLTLKQARVRVLAAQLRARDLELTAARRRAETAAAQLGRVAGERVQALALLRTQSDLTRREVSSLDALARKAEHRSVVLTSNVVPVATAAAATTRAAATRPVAAPARSGTRTLTVDAVAYHLGGRTASGLPVGVGVVAVDPRVIPLGTRMFVPGYGAAVAADVGTAVKGNIIDLWMPTRAKALAWGRRTVTITIYG